MSVFMARVQMDLVVLALIIQLVGMDPQALLEAENYTAAAGLIAMAAAALEPVVVLVL